MGKKLSDPEWGFGIQAEVSAFFLGILVRRKPELSRIWKGDIRQYAATEEIISLSTDLDFKEKVVENLAHVRI